MNTEALHLAHPDLLHGLWLWLLVVLVFLLLDRRAADRLNRLVSPALEERLVERPAAWRRRLRFALHALAGLLMVGALVRPQWGEQVVSTPRVGAEIMIALDVSRSMLADDARPSRLERAKAEIRDLLAYLDDDQVGLIAFAGRASILSPLTPDKSFLRLALDGAGPQSVSRGGTRLAEPIQRAVAGLGEPGPAQRALLLITDGEDHDSFALDAAKRAAEAGIKIITIGFGDEAGTQIHVRNPEDGSRTLVRDGDGNPVISRLNGELLREIALATDGAYVPAGTGVLDLASIYETHIARLTRGQLDSRGRTIRGETYPYFVAGALVCLVAGVVATGGRGRRPAGVPVAVSRRARGAVVAIVLLGSLAPKPGLAQAEVADPPALPGATVESAATAAAPAATAPAAAAPAAALPAATAEPAPVSDADAPAASAPVDEDPRTRFNRANALLAAGDASQASSLFRDARRDAVDDLELRYAASYNLGMAAVAQADALEAGEPKRALALLHEAADWFREASAMQPDEDDPRHNLEVTLRRALILADELARRESRDVEGELDRLIESQRARVAEAAALLEAVVRAGELADLETAKPAFDAAATAERELMADAESLGDRVADEKALLAARPEAERKPEDLLRAASLEGVLAYLDQGIERMGQMRRQLRQRSAERAYRRGAEALDLLKRARDQLRDPVEQIGVLIGEVTGVARATAMLESDGTQPVADAPEPSASAGGGLGRLPAFLTPEAIGAETASVEARVGELAERLTAAAEQAASEAERATSGADPSGASPAPAAGVPGPGDPAAASSDSLREALVAAAPLVREAGSSMERAVVAVGEGGFEAAITAEGDAVDALGRAQELFFDLRELLEATLGSELRIAAAARSEAPDALALRKRAEAALAESQQRNQGRVPRIDALLEAERSAALAARTAPADAGAATGAAPGAASTPSTDPAEIEALERRFDRAGELLEEAAAAMAEAGSAFASKTAGSTRRATDWTRVGDAATRAAERLDALRTLFLSLVELLQRLEREQVDLGDRSRSAIALAGPATPRSAETRARMTAIASDQQGLEQRAGAIADALLAQSEARGADGSEGSAPSAAPDADTLRRAADHVASAQLAMQEASELFADDQRALPPAVSAQTVARDELRKAIALLAPPPPPKEQDQEQDQEQKNEQEQSQQDQQDESQSGGDEQQDPSGNSGDEDEGQEEEQPEPAESESGSQAQEPESEPGQDAEASASEDPAGSENDPAQLLQGVRDREAERRDANERRERQRRRAAPVEKDW